MNNKDVFEGTAFEGPSIKTKLTKTEWIGFALYPLMLLSILATWDNSWFAVTGVWLIGACFLAFMVCLTSNNGLLKLKKEYSYKKVYTVSTVVYVVFMIAHLFIF